MVVSYPAGSDDADLKFFIHFFTSIPYSTVTL